MRQIRLKTPIFGALFHKYQQVLVARPYLLHEEAEARTVKIFAGTIVLRPLVTRAVMFQ